MHVGLLQIRHGSRGFKFALGSSMVSSIAGLFEMGAIVLASLATGTVWHLVTYGDAGDIQGYVGVGALTGVLYALPFMMRSEYRVDQFIGSRRALSRILNIWTYAFFCLGALAFLTKTTGMASRGWLAMFFVLGATTVVGSDAALRAAIRFLVGKGLVDTRRLMVIGTQSDVTSFAERHSAEASGISVVSTVILSDKAIAQSEDCAELDAIIGAAIERARSQSVSDVMILVSASAAARLASNIANRFMDLPVAVHLGKQLLAERFPDLQVAQIGKTRTLALRSRPLNAYQLALKRIFDATAAATGLILLAPLFAVIALAIKLDSRGPVFFRQRRRGFNLQEFAIWKFRTMTTLDDGDSVVQAQANDPRVTRVGRILRRLNLDELPQLINVIWGDMSLVGPRPHAVAHDRHYERLIKRYTRRLNVKPGITGWAQVNGFRGITETEYAMRSRITHDLYYIDNWSIALDMYIILLTVFSPKAFRNAG